LNNEENFVHPGQRYFSQLLSYEIERLINRNNYEFQLNDEDTYSENNSWMLFEGLLNESSILESSVIFKYEVIHFFCDKNNDSLGCIFLLYLAIVVNMYRSSFA
jgi:hypothetical protein